MNTKTLLVLGALAAVVLFLVLRKKGGVGMGMAWADGYSAPPMFPPGAGPADALALTAPGMAAPKSSTQKAADILANKTGTKLICTAVSTYYTGGAANGTCGAVAEFANAITEKQIAATKAVASKVASGAKTVASKLKFW